MPFKNDFFWILIDFWTENGAKLAPKSCQKSMLTSNGRFSRKRIKTYGFSLFFVNLGTRDGSQNALKFNPRIYSKMKCILASIFHDFGRFWEASWCPNGSKNRSKNASKIWWKKACILVRFGRSRSVPGRGWCLSDRRGWCFSDRGFQVPKVVLELEVGRGKER